MTANDNNNTITAQGSAILGNIILGVLEEYDRALFQKLVGKSWQDALPIIRAHYPGAKIEGRAFSVITTIMALSAQNAGLVTLTEKGKETFYEHREKQPAADHG